MDFSVIDLDDDLRAFQGEVSSFFDEHLSSEVLERERRAGNGLLPALERALAQRGWVDTTGVPGRAGTGLDPVRLAMVDAEEGRRAGPMLPVKGSNRLVRSVVHAFGSDDLRAEVLAGVADGEVTCCLGYTEPDCGSDAAAVTTRATRDGDEWVVTGQKMFSTGAHLCQYVMITARTDPDAPKHRGITMFLVPTNTPGVETQGISTLGGERTNFVYFDGARIADRYRLGPVDQGWRVASGALAAEHGIDDGTVPETAVGTDALLEALRPMNGGWQNELAAVHDAALAWAMTPPVAGAPPPIDDPQVRRRLAQVALDAELVAVTPNPYARVIASDLLVRDAADLLDMTGAAGMLEWGEAGSPAGGYLEWAHRFAQGTSIYGGTTDIQRNLIAEQFLGLPRHAGPVRG